MIDGHPAENAFAFLYQELKSNVQTPLKHQPNVFTASALKRKALHGNIPRRSFLFNMECIKLTIKLKILLLVWPFDYIFYLYIDVNNNHIKIVARST